MANFTLVIETDNDAFAGENKASEIARILEDIADQISDGDELFGSCYDINGNTVGWYGERNVRASK